MRIWRWEEFSRCDKFSTTPARSLLQHESTVFPLFLSGVLAHVSCRPSWFNFCFGVAGLHAVCLLMSIWIFHKRLIVVRVPPFLTGHARCYFRFRSYDSTSGMSACIRRAVRLHAQVWPACRNVGCREVLSCPAGV